MPVDDASVAATLGTGARVVDGVLHVSLSMRTEETGTRYLLGAFAYGDGSADVLVSEEGACIAQLAGRGAPGTFRILPRQGDFEYRVGEFDFSKRALTWLEPPLTIIVDAFDFEGGWGGVQTFAELLVASDPMKASLASVYTSSGLMFYPTSNGGLVAVTEAGSSGRILGWAPSQPVWPIASGSATPMRLGLSSERIAWLGATGPQVNDGLYESAAFYSCARPELGSSCEVQKGPDLPITTSTGVLVTEGRFMAVNL